MGEQINRRTWSNRQTDRQTSGPKERSGPVWWGTHHLCLWLPGTCRPSDLFTRQPQWRTEFCLLPKLWGSVPLWLLSFGIKKILVYQWRTSCALDWRETILMPRYVCLVDTVTSIMNFQGKFTNSLFSYLYLCVCVSLSVCLCVCRRLPLCTLPVLKVWTMKLFDWNKTVDGWAPCVLCVSRSVRKISV